ncbi:MAG TPA: hypothetical protein VII94_03215 [Candidatus Saccharimonadales bacterium]
MSSLPPAIIFCNGDITYPLTSPPTPPYFVGSNPTAPNSYASPSELTNLETQLSITDTMTKTEFDARVAVDPNYPLIVHLQGLRILVILPDFHDKCNSDLADVVVFLHSGLADIERNRLGWPGKGRPDDWHDDDYCEKPDVAPSIFHPPIRIEYPQEGCNKSWEDSCEDGYHGEDGYHEHHRSAFGPPIQSYNIQRLNIYELLRAGRSDCGVFMPFSTMPHCESCKYPFYCDACHTFSGIKICRSGCGECRCGCGLDLIGNQGLRISPIHLPNCDNEAHNPDFINRK